jgi:hypothetical protein
MWEYCTNPGFEQEIDTADRCREEKLEGIDRSSLGLVVMPNDREACST